MKRGAEENPVDENGQSVEPEQKRSRAAEESGYSSQVWQFVQNNSTTLRRVGIGSAIAAASLLTLPPMTMLGAGAVVSGLAVSGAQAVGLDVMVTAAVEKGKELLNDYNQRKEEGLLQALTEEQYALLDALYSEYTLEEQDKEAAIAREARLKRASQKKEAYLAQKAERDAAENALITEEQYALLDALYSGYEVEEQDQNKAVVREARLAQAKSAKEHYLARRATEIQTTVGQEVLLEEETKAKSHFIAYNPAATPSVSLDETTPSSEKSSSESNDEMRVGVNREHLRRERKRQDYQQLHYRGKPS